MLIFQAFIYIFFQRSNKINGIINGFINSNYTDRELIEAKLVESDKKYRDLFENNMDSAFSMDTNGEFVEINRMGSVVTGFENEELIGKSFIPFIPPEEPPAVLGWFETVLKGEPVRFETRWIHKQGHTVDVDVDVTAMPIFVGNKLIGVFSFTRDITEQKRYQQEMKDLAYKDSLTKLSNRRFIMDELESKLSAAKLQEQKLAYYTSI